MMIIILIQNTPAVVIQHERAENIVISFAAVYQNAGAAAHACAAAKRGADCHGSCSWLHRENVRADGGKPFLDVDGRRFRALLTGDEGSIEATGWKGQRQF